MSCELLEEGEKERSKQASKDVAPSLSMFHTAQGERLLLDLGRAPRALTRGRPLTPDDREAFEQLTFLRI